MAAPPPNNSPPGNPSGNLSPGHEITLFRFGVFELDRSAGELRRTGKRIRLQEQPFQVLVLLLESAGKVVTRDEFRNRIWPADTFVDFDHSLNTAMNKIREALGDSASSPRFVETVARRGYRFIAPVAAAAEWQGLVANASSASSLPPQPAGAAAFLSAAAANGETVLRSDLDVPVPHRGLVRVLFGLIQVMFLSFYLAALSQLHEVDRVAGMFIGGGKQLLLLGVVLLTGTLGIPLRCYLISAVAFDFRKLGANFRRLFPFVLAIDLPWAMAPFLLVPQIGIGLAFAATAALLYVPFSERTLVRMAYPQV
jgi:DNA-binding winged helix-turn-helix (wHTH) protein